MKITKLNYEVFALDYLEGNLSELQELEMIDFLKEHPEIEAELLALQGFEPVVPAPIVFKNKAALLKKEKVVYLTPMWKRAMSVAAAVALLLTAYFMGYENGNQGDINSFAIETQEVKTPTILEIPEQKASPIQEVMPEISNPTITKKSVQAIANNEDAPEVEKALERFEKLVENMLQNINPEENQIPELPTNVPQTPQKRVIESIASLPTGNIKTIKPSNHQISEPAVIIYSETVLQNSAVLAANDSKGRRVTFKSLLPKLPSFEGVKVSFIPTYFEDKFSD